MRKKREKENGRASLEKLPMTAVKDRQVEM
jgi:hypothetical protein